MKLKASTRILDFACHSAACRPPTSGGTGGSSPIAAQHVTTSEAAPKILSEGFRDDVNKWQHAFGRGIYFAHEGDTESADFYSSLGGRSRDSSQVISAIVTLNKPMRLTGKTKEDIENQMIEQMGGINKVQSLADEIYNEKANKLRQIFKEELDPETFKATDLSVIDERIYKHLSEQQDMRIDSRMRKELEINNIYALTDYKDVTKKAATSWGGATEILGNIARMKTDFDGLVIDNQGFDGTVGGSQIVAFSPKSIKVRGSKKYETPPEDKNPPPLDDYMAELLGYKKGQPPKPGEI